MDYIVDGVSYLLLNGVNMIRDDDIYGIKEKQEELLNLIKKVDSIFNKYNIKYSLCGGTLLGSIRHNGFIPWDDDMDIMLNRKNFNLLKKVSFAALKNEGLILKRDLWVYRIQYIGKTDRFKNPTVDIFVADYVPDSDIVSKLKVLYIRILQGMMHEKLELKNHSLFNRACLIVTFLFGRMFSNEKKYKWYENVSQWGCDGNKAFCTLYNDLYKLLKIKYPGDLMNKVSLHKFEDTMLPITNKYDDFLRLQYGDYMILPPENKRIPEHQK